MVALASGATVFSGYISAFAAKNKRSARLNLAFAAERLGAKSFLKMFIYSLTIWKIGSFARVLALGFAKAFFKASGLAKIDFFQTACDIAV